jgi:hypothetical protein
MSNYNPDEIPAERDSALLRQELEEAHKTIRTLLRQLDKDQVRHHETTRAYNLTVANIMDMTRENTALARERDEWRARAEGQPSVFDTKLPFPHLSPEEAAVIRKAMARLYEAGAGQDPERLKLWNALLKPIEPE